MSETKLIQQMDQTNSAGCSILSASKTFCQTTHHDCGHSGSAYRQPMRFKVSKEFRVAADFTEFQSLIRELNPVQISAPLIIERTPPVVIFNDPKIVIVIEDNLIFCN